MRMRVLGHVAGRQHALGQSGAPDETFTTLGVIVDLRRVESLQRGCEGVHESDVSPVAPPGHAPLDP